MKGLSEFLEANKSDSAVWISWSWNGRITEKEIRSQLRHIGSSGTQGIIVRPSSDMFPLYLSDEFWTLFEYLLSLAEESGIKVMLGDDFSRLGDSLFLSEVSSRQSFRAARLTVAREQNLEAGDVFTFSPSRTEREYVVAVRRNKRKVYIHDARTLFDGESAEQEIEWKVPEGHWKVVVFRVVFDTSCEGAYIPNFFSMKAAQSYINNVLDPLKDQFLPRYKDCFFGIYCELPAILPSKSGIPWDDDLLISKYRSRYKRNLIETMPALFYDVADNEVKYRPHVYNFLKDTLYDRFPSVVDKWTTQNNLEVWVAGPESDRAGSSTYLPELFSYPTGEYDAIGTVHAGNKRVNDIASLSLLSRTQRESKKSFALIGRSRTMESHTIGELKQEALFYIVNGADYIIIDGIKFNRNYRYEELAPQGISFGSPDFQTLSALVQVIDDNIAFSSSCHRYGESVAIVYPGTSIMSDYSPADSEVIKSAYKNMLDSMVCLQELGIKFEIVDEQMLLDCDITPDGLIVNNEEEDSGFTGVVLPYSRLINNSFFVKLEQMAKKKIAIYFVDSAPEGSFDDGHSPSFMNRVKKLIRSKSKKVDHGLPEKLCSMFNSDIFRGEIKTKCITNSAQLWKKSVEVNGNEGYWLFNSGYEDCSLKLYPYENTESDDAGDTYIGYDISDRKLFPLDMETYNRDVYTLLPGQSVFVAIDYDKTCENDQNLNKYRIKLKRDRWKFDAQSLNSFPLSRWSSKIGISRASGALTYYSEGHFISQENNYSSYLVFLNTIPYEKESLPKRFKVSVNGNELFPLEERIPGEGERDAFFDGSTTLLVYDMSSSIIKGNNRVLLLSNGHKDLPDPVKFPPFVAVDNPVDKAGKVWTVKGRRKNEEYEWGGAGYPFLIGTGVYTITFEVPNLYEKIYMNFTRLSGSAEVILNGVSFDLLQWPPYKIDITDHVNINERNNLTVKIKNTLDVINRLSAEKSGILGPVYIDIYGDKSSESGSDTGEEKND